MDVITTLMPLYENGRTPIRCDHCGQWGERLVNGFRITKECKHCDSLSDFELTRSGLVKKFAWYF